MLRSTIALSLSACAAANWATLSNNIATIDLGSLTKAQSAAFKETGFQVARNGSIRFEAHSNPSTGYAWHVKEDMANGAFTVEENWVRDDAPEGYVGVGGTRYWTISASEEVGDGTFAIWLGRSWEGEKHAMNVHEFPIHIY